jgi:hypothetical protein
MLNDFANEVKEKRAQKLDYDLWRPLALWAKPGDGERDIAIDQDDMWNFIIAPITDGKSRPNPVYIDDAKNPDFWHWVNQEYQLHCFQAAWDAINSACSNAVADVNTATKCYSHHDWNTADCAALTSNTLAIGSDSNWCTPTIEINSDNFRINGESLEDSVKHIIENITNLNVGKEKENKTMNFNFDFGPVDSSVRMSLYGMAIKNASGSYVAYDSKSKQIVDVDILNFEGANKFMYKMPVAIKDVRSGDVVVHCRKPMFVNKVQGDGRLKVLDIYTGEEKTIVPTTSPFGFNFITKVVSLVDMTGVANAENPFGNLLPFLLLSDDKNDDMLPLALMAGGNMDMSNPMMMYALMGNRTNDPMVLALAMGAFNKPTHTCTCGGNCHCDTDK